MVGVVTLPDLAIALARKHRLRLSAEGAYLKLELDDQDPILIERFGKYLVLIGRSFTSNGEFTRHPEFTYRLEEGIWQPVSYRRGCEICECAELDDEENVVAVDPVHDEVFALASLNFAQKLCDEGWLERSVCTTAMPIIDKPSTN